MLGFGDMEYITSRGFYLPDSAVMETSDWFNLWRKKYFPYNELLEGDVIYWYETKSQRLVYKTEVVFVRAGKYNNKKKFIKKHENNPASKYFKDRPDKGYFVLYKVKVIEKINIPKPKGSVFPQLGWIRVDEAAKRWFDRKETENTVTLDQKLTTTGKTIAKQLKELNKKMQNVSPERIEKIVMATIRKDTAIIKALKKAANFTCQFPGCGHQIKKKKGGYYVEVAHIKSVARGGQSILGNLIVLCPNHHKEFDYGSLSVRLQTPNRIAGKLNNREFDIMLSNA